MCTGLKSSPNSKYSPPTAAYPSNLLYYVLLEMLCSSIIVFSLLFSSILFYYIICCSIIISSLLFFATLYYSLVFFAVQPLTIQKHTKDNKCTSSSHDSDITSSSKVWAIPVLMVILLCCLNCQQQMRIRNDYMLPCHNARRAQTQVRTQTSAPRPNNSNMRNEKTMEVHNS